MVFWVRIGVSSSQSYDATGETGVGLGVFGGCEKVCFFGKTVKIVIHAYNSSVVFAGGGAVGLGLFFHFRREL